LDIHIYDTHSEDAKKHLGLQTDSLKLQEKLQMIKKSLSILFKGKVVQQLLFWHTSLAKEKMKLKEGLALLRQFVPEVEPNESFM
jgi:hypothetical protein